MTDREELIYRTARALDTSRTANEYAQAADEGHSTPESAAQTHWDAAGLMEGVLIRFQALRDAHHFEAKRYEREARKERLTGEEYRGGSAA